MFDSCLNCYKDFDEEGYYKLIALKDSKLLVIVRSVIWKD